MKTERTKGLSFANRLQMTLIGMLLLTIISISSVIFYNIVQSGTQEVRERASLVAGSYADQFNEWMLARMQEVQVVASMPYSRTEQWSLLYPLLENLALTSPYFDSLILVDAQGDAQVGLQMNKGQVLAFSPEQLQTMSVPDREWFKQASQGKVYIQPPIVSRATGNLVATVAVPILNNGRVTGVMTGSVQVAALIDRLQGFDHSEGVEIFILDQMGAAVSPAASIDRLGERLTTAAGDAAREQQPLIRLYDNAIGQPVVGAVQPIESIGWSMAMEINTAQAWAEITQLFWLLVWMSVGVMVLAVGVSWWLVQRLQRTLGGDPEYAAAIVKGVAEGDLRQNISLKAGDNSSLLAAIAHMQAGLRSMMTNVADYATQVSASAAELAQINQQSEQGVVKQTDDIRGTATAMTEMSSTLQEVARNTQQAAVESREANSSADVSRKTVEQAVLAMQGLVKEIRQAAEIINKLKDNSDQVGSILEVIESIAEQTNLLALNAAIEAARAGDSGRGFAVVADEVRNLAGRTKESTTEIQTKIDGLQQGAEDAVAAMQSSASGSTRAMEQVQEMDQALLAIIAKVQTIDQYAMQIASATEEQTQVADDINQNMNSINEVADQTQERVQQSVLASNQLSQLAEQLQSLLTHFRY